MKSTKTKIIIMMCAVLCIMAVGYAAFSTVLTITGTANIASEWKVVFTKIEEVSKTSGVNIKSTPVASGTTATFNVGLTSPGDKIEYKITVANQGTLDAVINDIEISETGNDAIIFEVKDIEQGDTLLGKTSTTFNVTIEYNPNVTSQPNNLTNTLTVTVNYLQHVEGNGGGGTSSVVFNKETPRDLTFTSQEDISTFQEVKVDNETVDSSNYTVTSGSTIITLKKEYLRTLSKGIHTIDIVSTNATISTTFQITTTKSSVSLVEKILSDNEVYADNVASKYVTNSTGIYFTEANSDTNGKGLYYTTKNTENNLPSYYFRGVVTNNYVKLGNFALDTCMYNGGEVVDILGGTIDEETCTSGIVCDVRFLNSLTAKYIIAEDATYCDTIFESITEVPSSVVTCHSDGIPIVSMDNVTGEISPLQESDCVSKSFCKIDLNGANAGIVGISKEECMEMGGQLTSPENNSYDTSYPIKEGKASYLENTRKDIMWKIIRINEDGSIRMITNEAMGKSVFNEKSDDNAYVGYMYGATGQTGNNAYNLTHSNDNPSTIKTYLDDWYKNKSNLSSYSNLISNEAGFCNDRSVAPSAGLWESDDTALGYAQNYTIYGATGRLYDRNLSGPKENAQPQFACPNEERDLFTMSSSTKGNKKLTYPVGLITLDELSYAGVAYFESSHGYYLSSMNSLTMSPYSDDNIWYLDIYSWALLSGIDSSSDVHPVINLSPTVEIIQGNGTIGNPYIIKTH